MDAAMPEDVPIPGNVVALSPRNEWPKTKRKIERFERETSEQFERRVARIAELEIELGIF
jgi:hypothetical protein